MLNSLGKIDNPLVRAIAAASTSFAMVIFIAAVALGLPDPKNKSVNKIGIYASLLAFVAGAGVGLAVKDNSPAKSKQVKNDNIQDNTWQDWRDFKIVRKEPESTEITSFYFQPVDGGKLPDFQPGQFLTIKLNIPEQDRPVIRTYSLSDYPESQDYYRLSIKREGSPKGLDVPPGVASNFMHDRITTGSIIPCKPPSGKFYLEVDNSIPAVLISNGVGITPMISMAKTVARQNPQRHVWFIHGARNGEYHAFGEEVNQVSQSHPNLHIHYCYSRPRPEDEGKYHSQGYADKQLLADTIIPEIKSNHDGAPDAEYFLCGSPAFMDSLREGLRELDVAEDRVFFESFGGGKTKGKAKATSNDEGSVSSAEVVFARSNQTLTWTTEDGTLLEFAEANNINPDFSCRQGICLTCMCQLHEGEVEYIEEPGGEPDENAVLICVSKPKTDKIVLDL
ncbi:2Fe-2S iron-sulfur cluster binding domain-containing protein [Waterburya agarophytonicola K14]|uniref:nitric oxide dioxygenase n=1 Tax=Waterburya agarophytonicola KI4 TaxID=2874699 RepID=A0A964FF68_9CYAN|nr:2Fe-2S iron-sulfur cluster-binding protein [Waterburya agarophytonicola]MCC0177445.1 2Fe-2S iron-sulfur cluster binding domain-containing protein [Waterburya agarophytonicola KI4]